MWACSTVFTHGTGFTNTDRGPSKAGRERVFLFLFFFFLRYCFESNLISKNNTHSERLRHIYYYYTYISTLSHVKSCKLSLHQFPLAYDVILIRKIFIGKFKVALYFSIVDYVT